MDDEWLLVGGKGKAKKKGGVALKKQLAAAAAATGPVHGTATPEVNNAPYAAHMPGWESSGKEESMPHATAHPKPRRGRHRLLERSPEEIAADLHQQILQCRSEVEGSSIFASLRQAFSAAALHLCQRDAGLEAMYKSSSHAPIFSSQDPQQVQPQLQGQQQQQQLQPQQHRQGQQQLPQHMYHSQLQQQQDLPLQGPGLPHEQPQGKIDGNKGQYCGIGTPGGQGAADDVGALQGSTAGWYQVQELIIYGLGSMQTSCTSRYQLAMASLLAAHLLPGLRRPPMAFDPAFTDADTALLASMGIAVIPDNQMCAHRADVPTFFYLPHLEGRLCDNLLAANSGSHAPHVPQSADASLTCSPAHAPDGSSPHPTAHPVHSPPRAQPTPCTAHPVQSLALSQPHTPAAPPAHTLRNCVLLANRFSTYEARATGPPLVAAKRCGLGTCKQGRKGGGDGQQQQQQHGEKEAGGEQDGIPQGLEALLECGQPATMRTLLAAGAVLEFQVQEDKRFPSPSAFNDMALHVIP